MTKQILLPLRYKEYRQNYAYKKKIKNYEYLQKKSLPRNTLIKNQVQKFYVKANL